MELRVNPQPHEIGEKLRAARDLAALSQAELAVRLGVSARTVQNWESGQIVPQPKHRRAISSLLDELEAAA